MLTIKINIISSNAFFINWYWNLNCLKISFDIKELLMAAGSCFKPRISVREWEMAMGLQGLNVAHSVCHNSRHFWCCALACTIIIKVRTHLTLPVCEIYDDQLGQWHRWSAKKSLINSTLTDSQSARWTPCSTACREPALATVLVRRISCCNKEQNFTQTYAL